MYPSRALLYAISLAAGLGFLARGPLDEAAPAAPALTPIAPSPAAQSSPGARSIEDPRPMGQLGRSDLQVLYTAGIDGYLEPCGCVAGRMGGIDRIAAYVENQRALHPALLYLDAGDLFYDSLEVSGPMVRQLPVKAEAFFAGLAAVGCDAVALGEFDLVLKVETLKQIAAKHGVPLLAGNLVDQAGQHPFDGYRIVERGGLKIGIIGLISDQFQVVGEESKQKKSDIRPLLEAQGLTIEPSLEAAQRLIDELRPQVDRLIVLSHLGFARNRRLAEGFPELDLIVGGHIENSKSETVWIQGVPLAQVYEKGSRVGRVDFWWQRGQGARPAGSSADISDRLRLAVEVAIVADDLEMLRGREGVFGSTEFERREEANRLALARLPEQMERLPRLPKGSLFAHTLVPMFEGLGRSEAILETLDLYHDQLANLWAYPGQPRKNTRFVEAAACQGCHPAQYDFWKGMRHSRAWHTLEVTKQQFDVECIGCHSVGFEQSGGYQRPNEVSGFENVQCASCHGPAADHLADPLGYLTAKFQRPEDNCAGCHNKQHDPRFDLGKQLPLVTCPPNEAPGQGSPAMKAALAETAEFAAASGRWGEATQARRRLADFEATLAAARNWRKAEPKVVRARELEAEALIELGQTAEAAELLKPLLKRDQSNPITWSLYARALLKEAPHEAMSAAREAYSLAPNYAENAMLLAKIALELDHRLDALDVLRAHLERLPDQRAALQPLIDEIGGLTAPEDEGR